jgi:hypothetical protein
MIHPQEALLQEARAFQQSEAFAPYRKLRQVAEHRLARLMQLGVRQARYIGRTKMLCQLLLAATVANLTLVASRVGLMRDRNHIRAHSSNQVGDLLTTILRAICRPFVVGVLPWTTAQGQVFGHTSRRTEQGDYEIRSVPSMLGEHSMSGGVMPKVGFDEDYEKADPSL